MKLNLTRALGALSLGALALVGCQSGGDPGHDEEAAAATAESTCSGRDTEKDEREQGDAGGR